MRHFAVSLGLVALAAFAVLVPETPTGLIAAEVIGQAGQAAPAVPSVQTPAGAEVSAQAYARARYQADLAAVQRFRPAYSFWQHIFNIPDGRIIFGSAEDGRLLATFPTRGNWAREGVWEDSALAGTLDGLRLQSRLNRRRDQVEDLLAPIVGPVVHNPTRGRFLAPHAERNGSFLGQWGSIYERFGVPAEIGLAQAIVESGLNGRARSSAQALGFCQWLRRNWNHLNRLAPNVIEAYNQTTQAPYCAAHLTILATMYGSFIPALSEHHAGGVNVGRTVINGERLLNNRYAELCGQFEHERPRDPRQNRAGQRMRPDRPVAHEQDRRARALGDRPLTADQYGLACALAAGLLLGHHVG